MCGICLVRGVATAVLLASAASPVLGQPTGAVTLEFPLQSTTVLDAPTETASLVSGSGSFGQRFAEGQGRVFYDVSLDQYGTVAPFGTHLHNAGGVYTFELGEWRVSPGAAGFWRVNSGAWTDTGFRGFNLQSTVERTLGSGTVTGAYNVFRRGFPAMAALSHLEHYGYVRSATSFQTRTTIVGSIGAGWKRYDGEAVEAVDLVPAPLAARESRGGGARAAALEPAVADGSIRQPAVRTLWVWSARIAQSLDDRTGVWVEREERRPGGDPPPTVVWTPPLFYDDGVYDDPYVVEAFTWRGGGRHVFARGDEVAVWIDSSERRFAPVDLSGTSDAVLHRADRRFRTGIDAEVVVRSTRAADILLVAGYTYYRNQSSDADETYRSHIGSAGFSVRF